MRKIATAFLLFCTGLVWGTELDVALQRVSAKQIVQPQNKVRIACELKKGDTYQLATPQECLKDPVAKEEVALLERFLIDLAQFSPNTTYNTKYLGPVNLSEQIFQQTFLVNHSWRAITERFLGFGPEDDPQFDYTQPGYYPNGTVKVNLTERAFDVIRLYYGEIVPNYGADSAPAKGLRGLLGMLGFHELMHGWQLHTLPVLDYKRLDLSDLNKMLDSRTPDYKIVWGSQQITNYEEDANVFTYHYMASVYPNFEAFVHVFEELSQQPGFFEKYPRLADSFYQYYLVNQLQGAKEVLDELASGKVLDTFNELNTYTYRGATVPLQTWADMVHINNQLNNGQACEQLEATVRAKYAYFMDLSEPAWNGRDASNPHDNIIMDTIRSIEQGYSGLAETKAAAHKEFKLFEETCHIKL